MIRDEWIRMDWMERRRVSVMRNTESAIPKRRTKEGRSRYTDIEKVGKKM